MSPIKLHVYDFDGTLFRSPEKPVWWEGGWWGNLNSLSEPCVPERPSSDWWNGTVVRDAKQSLANPDVRTILLTGRIQKFSLRLKDLLRQVGLHFEEIYLSPGGKTEAFKMKVIQDILKKEPTIRGVAIWEDRPMHLRMFADWVESNGRACIPHLITVPAHEINCQPPDSSAARVAARYKSKKKIETKDGEEATVYEYSERQVKNRHNQKAEKVEKIRKEVHDLRAKIRKDLTSEDASVALPALAAALIDETCERVGNDESASEGHFGVTGWQKKHVSFSGGKATFKYVGKSGVKHEKTVESAPVVKLLKELAKGKADSDCLLSRDDFTVKSGHVNDYLGEFDITAKDIRGFRANQEMCKALKAQRKKGPELPRPRKERDKILKKEFADALAEVADIVGHEKATLRSDYLVPGLEDSYMKDGTVLSSFKESKKATKSEAEVEDEATSDLIKPSPKKKPPREDLREHRIREEDADLEVEDDDLSLNFKKVAARIAMAVRIGMAVTVARRFLHAKAEKEDAFLKAVEGKTFVHPKTKGEVKFTSLPKEDQEKIRAEWTKKNPQKEEKPKRPKKEPTEEGEERVKSEEEMAEAKAKRVKSELREKAKYLGDSPAFDEDTEDFIEGTLDTIMDFMPLEDSQKFVEGLVSERAKAIDSVAKGGSAISGKPPNPTKLKKLLSRDKELSKLIEEIEEDPSTTPDEKKKSMEEFGKKRDKVRKEMSEGFAEFYAHKATLNAVKNPLTFIGDTSSPISKETVKDRAKESISRLRDLSPEDRAGSAKEFARVKEDTEDKITALEKKLSSGSADDGSRAADSKELESLKNRLGYLEADRQALELASIIEGDEVKNSSIPKGTRTLVKALKDSGIDVSDMVDAGLGIQGSEPQADVVSKLVRQLKPEQMESALEAVDPSGKLKDAWRKVYDADDADDYIWPMSKIRSRQQRRDVENAHAIFVEMLTDVAVGDSKTTTLPNVPRSKGKKGPGTKNKTPVGLSDPQEGFELSKEDPYESNAMDAMEKLDIPKTAGVRPIRYSTWPVTLVG